jgi:L-ascorbate metabolism protein UlaG (beta-lactamase superfamily)
MANERTDGMQLRRLGWSGIELAAGGASIVIDCVTGSSPFLSDHLREGRPVAPLRTPALAALVTHLHFDHTDVPAIEAAVGPEGLLLRPRAFAGSEAEGAFTVEQERALSASRLDVRVLDEWESHAVGPFTVTAVPAVDGLGDPQVGWVVEAEGARVFHGGDTLFHGSWWLIAGRLGPIDLAVLPVNGPVVNAPHLQPPSMLAAAMGPREAAQAAAILRATALVPSHYGAFIPGIYVEEDDPIATLRELAGSSVITLAPGESVDVAAG